MSKYAVAAGVWAFEFKPADGLTWIAGQFIRIEIPHALADDKGPKRFFTIAAAPHEKIVRIVTRLSDSSFKQTLDLLQPGDPVNLIDPPAGDFIWQDQGSKPKLLVAQGIGITPFYAILKHRLAAGQTVAAHLVYAGHNQDLPFLNELNTWAHEHTELRVSLVAAPVSAAGLAALEPDLAKHDIYICGPKSLIQLLGPPYNMPATQLKHDRFSGYSANRY